MTRPWFVDTNVLVYAVDDRDAAKQAASTAVLATRGQQLVVSAQVLGEFYVTVTRKLPRRMSPDAARRSVAELSAQHIVGVDGALVQRAIHTSQEHQLSYWDALIVEAAVAAGCDRILTEDLADGQEIRGVQIVNPFTSQSTA